MDKYNYYLDQIEHDIQHIETELNHSVAFLQKASIRHSLEHIKQIIVEYSAELDR